MTGKRLVDITLSLMLLLVTAPLIVAAMLAIRLSSPGPVFYNARRSGLGNRSFVMHKLRTMHVGGGGGAISAPADARVFRVGAILRAAKIDELPQLINVLKGEMSIVGPRPEDPAIVERHYHSWMLDTLEVLPGLTSPGSLFYYAASDDVLDPQNVEQSYVERLLRPKLAIDMAYLQRATVWSDIDVIVLTVRSILSRVTGTPVRPRRADVEGARRWVETMPDWA